MVDSVSAEDAVASLTRTQLSDRAPRQDATRDTTAQETEVRETETRDDSGREVARTERDSATGDDSNEIRVTNNAQGVGNDLEASRQRLSELQQRDQQPTGSSVPQRGSVVNFTV